MRAIQTNWWFKHHLEEGCRNLETFLPLLFGCVKAFLWEAEKTAVGWSAKVQNNSQLTKLVWRLCFLIEAGPVCYCSSSSPVLCRSLSKILSSTSHLNYEFRFYFWPLLLCPSKLHFLSRRFWLYAFPIFGEVPYLMSWQLARGIMLLQVYNLWKYKGLCCGSSHNVVIIR